MNIPTFAVAVYHYCTQTHASVFDWIRTPQDNIRKGDTHRSAHLVGLAVLVRYEEPTHGPDRAELAQALGLELEDLGDHDRVKPAAWDLG